MEERVYCILRRTRVYDKNATYTRSNVTDLLDVCKTYSGAYKKACERAREWYARFDGIYKNSENHVEMIEDNGVLVEHPYETVWYTFEVVERTLN